MIFGDVLKVVKDGFQISKTAMERIGVFNESVCWGVWVHDPRPNSRHKLPHLLISPSHPTVWPYLLRCEIKLRHSAGSMATASRILVDKKVNIQFGECAPSGHHHATWNIVAEAVAVRRELLTAFEETRRKKDPGTLEAFSDQLARRMFEFEIILENALVEAHKDLCPDWDTRKDEDCGFLHNRVVGNFPLFFNPARFPEGPLKEAAQRALPEAVVCRWMQNLAFFSIHGHAHSPIRFQYDEHTATLRLSDGVDLATVVQTAFAASGQPVTEYVPSRAQASIHTTEQSLRIDLLSRADVLRKYVRVRVDYRSQFQGDIASPPAAAEQHSDVDTTRGLWASLCGHISDAEVNLVKIHNRTTLRDPGQEHGSITLIGQVPAHVDTSQGWLDETQKWLEASCRPLDMRCAITPHVERLPYLKLFVSRRRLTPNHDALVDTIRARAAKWGLDPVVVHDPFGRRLTEEIEREMRESAALFQLVSFSDEEHARFRKDKKVVPDLGWLLYEYGLAGGLGIPRIRVVESSAWDQNRWKQYLKTDPDDYMVEFSADGPEFAIEAAIDQAMQTLARSIAKQRR